MKKQLTSCVVLFFFLPKHSTPNGTAIVRKKWNQGHVVFASLIYFILFKLITFTPFLGWMIMVLIACIAFGSIMRNVNWKRKPQIAIQ